MRKKIALGILALLILAFVGLSVLAGGPANVYGLVRYALPRMSSGDLRPGSLAPDVQFTSADGRSAFHLRERIGPRPLVLIFGSYTWPPFRRKVGDLVKIYDQFKDRAEFLTIYIKEAHPQDEWQMKVNETESVCYPQPRSLDARVAIVNDFSRRFRYPIPFGIDAMDDRAMKAFAAWPERIYIIGEDGRIAYKGGIGPFNYHPEEMKAWLEKRFPPSAN